MQRSDGSTYRSGQWLPNILVGATVSVVVAVLVVVLTVAVDRHSNPGIEIVDRNGASAVVHIAGEVATPGVYTIQGNGRLVDAVAAAGGLTVDADQSQLNLAARLGDGEHIEVPMLSASPDIASGESPGDSTLINVNTATADQLDVLPGIGPVLAGRIVDDREANGPYLTVDDLVRVDGISVATVEELRPLVTVDE